MTLKTETARISAFERKGAASERRAVVEAEFVFWVKARRARLLADWASERLGYAEAEEEALFERLLDVDIARAAPDENGLASILIGLGLDAVSVQEAVHHLWTVAIADLENEGL